MKQSDLQERQYVRVRPSLGEGFDFGRIVDLLPGQRLRVRWVLNPRRGAIVDAQDVISVGMLGEAALLADLEGQIASLVRRKPQGWGVTLSALGDALEYWLDLRRDGCNAQPRDFNDLLDRALDFAIKQKLTAEAKS